MNTLSTTTAIANASASQPVSQAERTQTIDILRGVALLGILLGQVVGQQVWKQAGHEQLIEWSMAAQPGGLYLLRAVSNGQQQTAKVVKPD